jgi:hypothetical protein
MFARIQTWWGLAVAGVAATIWGLNLTVLQPLVRTAKLAPASAENNTYWARDLRIDAIVAIVCALVLVARGDRGRSALAVGSGVLWLGADLALDRSNTTATTLVVTVAWLVILAFGLLGGAGGRPGPAPLRLAAAVAAGSTTLTVATASPTDTERWLTPTALATVAVLVLAAVGCALGAVPAVSRRRALVAMAVAVVAIGAMAAARIELGDGWATVICLPFLVAVTLIGAPSSEPLTEFGFAAVGLIVYLVAFLLFAAFSVMIDWPGQVLTALAGNPAVNSADTDLVAAFIGVPAGLAFGLATLAFARRGDARIPAPVPSAA